MPNIHHAHGVAMAAILFASPAFAENPLEMLQNEANPQISLAEVAPTSDGTVAAQKKPRAHLAALEKQTDHVSTTCFNGQLRGVLAQIGQRFGSPVIVTSGYRRSRTSYHGKCMAADIQIDGVSPGAIFAYARSLPSVGGVGRYGYTRSVHVDVAPRKFTWGTGRKRYAALGQGLLPGLCGSSNSQRSACCMCCCLTLRFTGTERVQVLFQPMDIVIAILNIRIAQQITEKRNGGFDAINNKLIQRALEPHHTFGAGAAMHDQFGRQ
jgi:uncharacterized protein YcbK (DUF882 family)